MAGDWIPYLKDLPKRREVICLATMTGRPVREVVAILMEFWAWADSETEDGRIVSAKCPHLMRVISDTDDRFWLCLAEVGWLVIYNNEIVIPNFERWIGKSAKRRLKESQRKRGNRQGLTGDSASCPQNVRKMSASHADKNGTTEQNRRDINTESFVFTKDSCSEPLSAISEPHIMSFPTNGKTESWGLTQSKLDEWKQTYPGVDAEAECRKAWQWCQDNPARRKTARGMTRFLSSWLERAQNRAGASGDPQGLFAKQTPGRGNSAAGKPSVIGGLAKMLGQEEDAANDAK